MFYSKLFFAGFVFFHFIVIDNTVFVDSNVVLIKWTFCLSQCGIFVVPC